MNKIGKLRAVVVAGPLLFALPLLPVCAQQQSAIILSCDGQTKLSPSQVYPVTKMGIVVKRKEHEVSFEEYVAPVESITDAEIVFRYVSAGASYTITGVIDRVTGKTSIEKLWAAFLRRLRADRL